MMAGGGCEGKDKVGHSVEATGLKGSEMKRTVLLVVCFTVALLAGCTAAPIPAEEAASFASDGGDVLNAVEPASNVTAGCIENYDPDADYFPHKVSRDYAKGWSVAYHQHYKVLTLHNPWRGAEEVFEYLLVQCGAPAPEGFGDTPTIEVPVRSVAALTSTVLPHLHVLGSLERLVAVDRFDYINTAAVREMIGAGALQEAGTGTGVNTEILIDVDPELVITFAYGNLDYDTHPKLIEAGLPVALTAGYMETTPLGRTEWLKVTSLFFNREEEAERVFNGIAERYAEMAELAAGVETRPTVLVGIARRDSWRVPGGNSYFARYVADAGGSYLWREDESTGSIPLAMETVFEVASSADVWLPNTGAWAGADDILAADERHGNLAAVERGAVFNNNAKVNEWGGNDYWETGVANPDLVLADLIKIFHPDLLPDHELIWFHRLD